MLLAQVLAGGWTVVNIAILIVVIAAVVALVYVALRQFGVVVPQWFIQVLWILITAFVIILAIKLVAAMF